MTANIQHRAEKNCAARFSQRSETCKGFQVVTPYISWQAEVTVTPKIPHRVTRMHSPTAWVQNT